jgi:large subunit ribosomal protein L44e
MKYPKQKRIHCPNCNKHTIHKVNIYKKGKQRSMCESDRRVGRKKAGYGSSPKEIQRKKVKVNKKVRPMFECNKCGYKIVGNAQRLKKFELIRK